MRFLFRHIKKFPFFMNNLKRAERSMMNVGIYEKAK